MEVIWEAIAPFLTQDWIAVARDLPQILISGLASGFQFALIAIGFVLIYRATETVNFAQGDIMVVGMFAALALQEMSLTVFGLSEGARLPWWLVIPLAIAIVAALGAMLDIGIFRNMAGQSPLATVIVTIALGFIIRNGIDLFFAPNDYNLFNPLGGSTVQVLGAVVPIFDICIVIGALIIVTGLFLFLGRTKQGLAVQAASQNQLAAYYQGISVRNLSTLVWTIAAGVSAFAGIMFAMSKPFTSSVGLSLSGGIMAYAAAIIGGFGSLRGAVVAALILGVIQQFVQTLSGLPSLVTANAGLIFLLIMLAVRPKGLFPQVQSKKV